MKKIIAIVVTLSTLLAVVPLTATAKANKIVGHVYASDIVAYIDDMPIKSYNIGGETMISLEGLTTQQENVPYGFQSEEQYGQNNNKQIGYSNYGFKTVWNEKNRTIKLYSIRKGSQLETKYGTFKIVGACYEYNVGEHQVVPCDTTMPDAIPQAGVRPFTDIAYLCSYLSIKPNWEKNSLLLNDYQKSDALLQISDGGSTDMTNAVLPIISIPVKISYHNNLIENFDVNAIVFWGDIFTYMGDWKSYLDK